MVHDTAQLDSTEESEVSQCQPELALESRHVCKMLRGTH